MSLFSTGYFSLNENDIKNLKDPSSFNKNEHYNKLMSKIIYSGFILFIIVAIYTLIGAEIYYNCLENEKSKLILIFQSILILSLIVLILIYTAEIINKNKVIEPSEGIPSYLLYGIETNSYTRLWIVLGFFAFQIPFFIININIVKEEIDEQKKLNEEALNSDKTDNIPEDFKVIQESGIDIELYKKA